MPRVTGIISEEIKAELEEHSERFGIAVSKLVAMGVPLAIEAHKRTIVAHAKTLTHTSVKAR